MKAHARDTTCFEFSFPRLDTVVEVESSTDRVVIRTSRDTFSEARRTCFVRELAAEGFIREEFRWRPPNVDGGVHWIVDASAFMPGPDCVAETNRFTVRLLFSATALWCFLLGGLFLATTP
jgi:hypothetical protein